MQNYDIKILATDINSDALITAAEGIYEMNRIRKMSVIRQKLWFSRIDQEAQNVQANVKLKELITFKQLNLASIWPMRGSFDVIFCRNVLIYLKSEVGHDVLLRFTKLLELGGMLYLGYADRINNLHQQYAAIGKTIYKKIHN